MGSPAAKLPTSEPVAATDLKNPLTDILPRLSKLAVGHARSRVMLLRRFRGLRVTGLPTYSSSCMSSVLSE